MDWFYEQRGEKNGPVDEAMIQTLLSDGTINKSTLVWNPNMPNWQPLEDVIDSVGISQFAAASPIEGNHVCVECNKLFPSSQLIHYSNMWVCGNCKATVFQRLKEGSSITTGFVFPGFWYRAGGKLIDGLILAVFNVILQSLMVPFLNIDFNPENPDFSGLSLFFALNMLVSMGIPILYNTFFLGKMSATPGKMVFGMKVIVADGSRITYGRACLRYLAEMVSAMIFFMGYIMAAWDDEKRTLHDRMCNTRVIKA